MRFHRRGTEETQSIAKPDRQRGELVSERGGGGESRI